MVRKKSSGDGNFLKTKVGLVSLFRFGFVWLELVRIDFG